MRSYASWDVTLSEITLTKPNTPWVEDLSPQQLRKRSVLVTRYISFFTVQGPADVARLYGDGLPWPTKTDRSGLGEGVYAWASHMYAERYLELRLKQIPVLEIVRFRIYYADFRNLKKLRVDSLPDPEKWMSKYSKLWGGVPDHGLEYITRETAIGREHFFHKSIFNKLKF